VDLRNPETPDYNPDVRRHPLFEELDASLAGLVPEAPVEFGGNWLPAARRTYKSASQSGAGASPVRDVVDLRWRGTLDCSVPIAGVAFLVSASNLFWSKSVPAASSLEVDVSLHAYADHSPKLATFAANIGGAALPGVAVPCGDDLAGACTLRKTRLVTARVKQLAQAHHTAFAVLLLQGRFLKIGRHRLWRIRDEFATSLPSRVRELLTRRRSGSIRWEPPVG